MRRNEGQNDNMSDTSSRIIVFEGVKEGAGATTLAVGSAYFVGKVRRQTAILANFDSRGLGDVEAILRARPKKVSEVTKEVRRFGKDMIRGYLNIGGCGFSAVSADFCREGQAAFFSNFIAPLYEWAFIDAGAFFSQEIRKIIEDGAYIILVHSEEILSSSALNLRVEELLSEGVPADRIKRVVNKAGRERNYRGDGFLGCVGVYRDQLQNILELDVEHPFNRDIMNIISALERLPPISTSTIRKKGDYGEIALIKEDIIKRLQKMIDVGDVEKGGVELRTKVRRALAKIVGEVFGDDLSMGEREDIVNGLMDDVLGFGPLEPLFKDPQITDIMVNEKDRVYVEREGRVVNADIRFDSDEQMRRVIERMIAPTGRRVDESSPMVDARLKDGSRVNIVVPPLSVRGPLITVRKFRKNLLGVDDLVKLKALSEEMAAFFKACVRKRVNILISGGTGTGKTTFLNAFSSFIPPYERIITIEDSAELKLAQEHVVSLEARPPNIEGKGAVTIRDLVRNALRMRPDRIIVGECRGGEALDMLQAMNTGHDGSMTTIHANSPRDSLSRLETLVLFSGIDLPSRAIREQIVSAIDIIVHLARFPGGERKIANVSEVVGMEGERITMQELFLYSQEGGGNGFHYTGFRPRFLSRVGEGFDWRP